MRHSKAACYDERQADSQSVAPHISRLKDRMREAPYEICLARAKYFTEVYLESEGMDPAMQNAMALERTLAKQKIFIYPDERLAGSKTEKTLSCPLSVERGDFLRALQLEMDFLEKKRQPFFISEEDKKLFREVILPYWDGRSVRDYKCREWKRTGILSIKEDFFGRMKARINGIRFLHYVGVKNIKKVLGAGLKAPISKRRLGELHSMRFDFALNNPTPAIFCLDVQGHLSLGVDKVVEKGMGALIKTARRRLSSLLKKDPENHRGAEFLEAAIKSLSAAISYSERFAEMAEEMAKLADDPDEKKRLSAIARHCRRVPRMAPRTFQEALQAAWMTQAVGEIQYGCMDVFSQGRIDQYLYPYLKQDLDRGRLTRAEAIALLQEYFLKLSANITPTPEVGMETNGVLGNSQHCIIIGGVDKKGEDATNELSFLCLEAYEQMGGTVNQLCVRLHDNSPPEFLRRTAEVFKTMNGIAIYNDPVVIEGLLADGLTLEDARDYCIIGCVETSGQADTFGCVGGHDLVLPPLLMLALSAGESPPPALGQRDGFNSGNPASFQNFEDLKEAVARQLKQQISLLIEAIAGKDRAHRDILPAPYVSALMSGCLDAARDITDGGAKYDFTSVTVRGLATFVDSLLAIQHFVYQGREFDLPAFIEFVRKDFEEVESLRSRILREPPKFGTGSKEADELTLWIIHCIHEEISKYRNIRGGKFRASYYSFGNHVIDGFLLGATPDGRRRGEPVSNGCSPSNLIDQSAGPLGCLKSIAKFPPEEISSGVSLNMRFHPSFIKTEQGLEAFSSMISTYFKLGGMHIQPNVVSSETLREAQLHPERYRDLVVKVSGYSAYFTDLGESIQEDIIGRCEFGS